LASSPIHLSAGFHPIQHIVTTRVLTNKDRLTILAPDKNKFLVLSAPSKLGASYELLARNPFTLREGVTNEN